MILRKETAKHTLRTRLKPAHIEAPIHIDINFMNQGFSRVKAQLITLTNVKNNPHILFGCTSEYLRILFWCYLLFLIQYQEQGHIWLGPLIPHSMSSSRSTTGLGETARKQEEN